MSSASGSQSGGHLGIGGDGSSAARGTDRGDVSVDDGGDGTHPVTPRCGYPRRGNPQRIRGRLGFSFVFGFAWFQFRFLDFQYPFVAGIPLECTVTR